MDEYKEKNLNISFKVVSYKRVYKDEKIAKRCKGKIVLRTKKTEQRRNSIGLF